PHGYLRPSQPPSYVVFGDFSVRESRSGTPLVWRHRHAPPREIYIVNFGKGFAGARTGSNWDLAEHPDHLRPCWRGESDCDDCEGSDEFEHDFPLGCGRSHAGERLQVRTAVRHGYNDRSTVVREPGRSDYSGEPALRIVV